MFLDLIALKDMHAEATSSLNDMHHVTSSMLDATSSTTSGSTTDTINELNKGAARAGCYIGAGLAMTGALGVGFGQGYVGGKAALAVAKNPDEYSRIRAMMLIGAAIAESSAIYALIIAILLIFVAPGL